MFFRRYKIVIDGYGGSLTLFVLGFVDSGRLTAGQGERGRGRERGREEESAKCLDRSETKGMKAEKGKSLVLFVFVRGSVQTCEREFFVFDSGSSRALEHTKHPKRKSDQKYFSMELGGGGVGPNNRGIGWAGDSLQTGRGR